MTTKKKLTILIVSLALVVIAVVATVVAVLAARNANLGGGDFNVNYTAVHVNAEVTGQYKVGSGSYQNLTTTDGTNKLVFTSDIATNSENATQSFSSIGDVSLKSTETLVFKYAIVNTADTTDDATENFTVSLGTINAPTNMTISYKTGADESTATTVFAQSTDTISVTEGSTVYIYVTLSITDADLDASFNGSINFVLTAVE